MRPNILPLLPLLAAAAAMAAFAAPPDWRGAVAGVRAERGVQGLYEAPRDAEDADETALLGGPLTASGTIIDPAVFESSAPTGRVYAVTALRTVHAARDVRVVCLAADGSPVELAAQVVAADGALDLALLAADGAPALPAAPPLAAGDPPPGTAALRAWFAADGPAALRDTVTHVAPPAPGDPYWAEGLPALALQQRVTPEASGGPLLDERSGALLGVTIDAERFVGGAPKEPPRGPQFAVPAARLAAFLRDAFAGRAPVHGAAAGPPLEVTPITPPLATLLGLEAPRGLYVLDAAAPLAAGDVLLRAAGQPLGPGGRSLEQALFDAPPGSALALDAVRAGRPLRVDLPVVPRIDEAAAAAAVEELGGAIVQDLARPLRDAVDPSQGVIVAHVAAGSAAEAAGLVYRDVVRQVFAAGRSFRVDDIASLRHALDALRAAPGFHGDIGLSVTDLRAPNRLAALRVLRLGERPAAHPQHREAK